jgi:glycerol-3-phosphate acyltransferase PlsX
MTVRVLVDAMGGDHAPGEVVRGSVAAARRLGVEVVLAGPVPVIEQALSAAGDGTVPGITILDAPEVIAMDEHAAAAVRAKRQSSIVAGLRAVRDRQADAFVSAGNTGAVMAGGVLVLGRIHGIERPALGAVFPTTGGGSALLLDTGANAEAKPVYLLQSAHMGRAYAAAVMRIADPRIGLLSIGEEASKGNELIQQVHALLKAEPGLRFVGNVEGNALPAGAADVVVTDGFTGNVALKVAEGAAELIVGELRSALTSRLHYKLAAALLRPALRQVRARIDYSEHGGAPLLGVNGVVIVAHGRSNARALYNAIRVARDAATAGIVQRISDALR